MSKCSRLDSYAKYEYNIIGHRREVSNATTYGQFNTDEQGPHFILGKVRYTIDDIAKSGAIAAVNSPEMLRTFQELGMPARPTARQSTITISVAADTRERLKSASKAIGRSVSNILEEIAIDWLEKNNL